MVSPGSIARPSLCLRCQLREVLLQTRIRPRFRPQLPTSQQRCNPFSTRPQSQYEGEDLLVRKERSYFWKRVKTPKGVIGKPGRRQRVVSERLSRDFLEKPANVIVFRDVAEEPEAQPLLQEEAEPCSESEPRPKALTAKEIENAITGHYIAPAEKEVNDSIDALRPDETVVDEREFQEHKQRLLKGYTFPQLSRYLARSVQAPTAGIPLREESRLGGEVHELGTTKWYSGQSPLQHRHSNVAKKAGPNTKAKLVEQVLRLVWHLTIQSEEQEVGELEVKLQPWQISMLFDISHNDRPQYQSFIRSSILVDTTQVDLYRPHGIMRVTGRRQDAEEVARQLKLALLQVQRLEVDFRPFSKLSTTAKKQNGKLFNERDLSFVSDLTKSVIFEEGDSVLAIYGRTESARHNARRLLLALLDAPFKMSFDATSQAGMKTTGHANHKKGPRTRTAVPVDLSSGLHRRYRGLELLRKVKPYRKDNQDDQDLPESAQETMLTSTQTEQSLDQYAPVHGPAGRVSRDLIKELEKVPSPLLNDATYEDNADSYWHSNPLLTEWKVDFGRMLYHYTMPPPKPPRQRKKGSATTPPHTEHSILQYQVPGLQTALSFFETAKAPRALVSTGTADDMRDAESEKTALDARMPYLIVHFAPSPSGLESYTKFPRLEMRFRLSTARPNTPRHLLLMNLSAIIDEQHLSVPLPQYAVDMQFSRQLVTLARLDMAEKNQNIQDFIAELRDSVQRRDGLLVAPPELEFRLPESLVKESTSSKEVEVRFLFERFEQVQRMHFISRQKVLEKEIDEEVKSLVRSMPNDLILDYREVEGGVIYGNRTMFGLRKLKQVGPAENGVPENEVPLAAPADQVESDAKQLNCSVVDSHHSPTLATDTAKVSEPDQEESQARTTHHGGEHGQAAPESTGDAQLVEQSAESSQDSSSKTRELVSTAIRFANLLTRATSGSLRHYGSQK